MRTSDQRYFFSVKKNKSALLIVDMINDFRHEDGDKLFRQVLPVAKTLAALKARARASGVPVIYVNDNFKQWHDSFGTTIGHVQDSSEEGRQIVETLRPGSTDYYILKPHRSGFYKTPLGVLLKELGADELIIAGAATDMCILSTAHDAHMRDYKLRIPRDCTAAITNKHRDQALDLMERVLHANTSPSSTISFKKSGRK
jgi:nicotinamidase-related amidase